MNQQQDQQQQQIQQQQENATISKQRYMDLYAMIFIVIIFIVSGILIFVTTEKTYIVAEEIKNFNDEKQAEDLKYVQDFQISVNKLLNQKHVQQQIIKDLKQNSMKLFDIYDLNGDGIVVYDDHILSKFQKSLMDKQYFIEYIKKNPTKLLFKFQLSQNKEKSQDLKKQLAFLNSKQPKNVDEENQSDKQTKNQFFSKLIQNKEKYELFINWLFQILDEDQNNQLDLQELGSDLQINYQKFTSITKDQWKQITNKVLQILTKQKGNSNALKNIKIQNQKNLNLQQNIKYIQIMNNQNLDILFEILNKIQLI
ncbi:hypothetical protein ABPG72_016212 [Tetrahymena utriculariae]